MTLHLPKHNWGTRTIDSYEKLECIGAGTYGQVFKARNKSTGEVVALKKIRTLNEPQGLPVTTIREIKLLKYLDHKNLVGLREIVASTNDSDDTDGLDHDSVSRFTSGSLYLVLEYVEHDLTGLLDRQYQFSDVKIKVIMKQLFEVILHLHTNDYIHRDIKCANLLLTNDHVLKLADFGLSRTLHGETNLTNKVVTLWYRSPELLMGETCYNAEVDMWSVGCVLAELYLGQPLFAGKTEMDQLKKIYELCGTPSETNWPSFKKLKNWDMYLPEKPFPGKLRKHLTYAIEKKRDKVPIPEGLLDLIEDLLQLNPKDRTNAENALHSLFFKSKPLFPLHPEDLPPIKDIVSSHELQTKRLRRDRAIANSKGYYNNIGNK